jgi:hypothetical protein
LYWSQNDERGGGEKEKKKRSESNREYDEKMGNKRMEKEGDNNENE